MTYILLFAFLSIVPGYLVLAIVRGVTPSFVHGVAVSHALLYLELFALRKAGFSSVDLLAVNSLLVGTLAAVFIAVRRAEITGKIDDLIRLFRLRGSVDDARAGIWKWKKAGGGLAVAVGYVVYAIVVGPYSEVPADVWKHLEEIQSVIRDSADGQVTLHWIPWYSLVAWLTMLSETRMIDLLFHGNIIHVTIFLLACYSFTLSLLSRSRYTENARIWMGIASCLFLVLHLGINVFSFVRYYAFAPVIVNFILFLSFSIWLNNVYFRGRIYASEAAILVVLSLAMAANHLQEAVFAYVFALSLSAIYCVRWFFKGKIRQRYGDSFDIAKLLSVCTLLTLPALFAYSRVLGELPTRLAPWVIDLGASLPFDARILIANPGFQVFQVITLWGVMIYGLYIADHRRIDSDVLKAGMLAPVVSLFNPLFVEPFISSAGAIVLWRLAFMIPVSFVAGVLLVTAVQEVRRSNLAYVAIVISISLVLLLKSIPLGEKTVSYGRTATLRPVPADVSPAHWRDLTDFMDSYTPRRHVVTDPVTGYMITALTIHRSIRTKFYGAKYDIFRSKNITEWELKKYKGWLFVVNGRNGGKSDIGRIARHWSEDVLQVSRYYSPEFLQSIEQNPHIFRMVFNHDNVSVYFVQ